MNLDTYEREFGHDPESLINYLFRLSEGSTRAEMILISDPESLAGPFAGGYGLLVVQDHDNKILPTIFERPVTIRLFGSDDCSWGVTVESLEVANRLVDELLELAPLTVQEIIDYCGMIFTN